MENDDFHQISIQRLTRSTADRIRPRAKIEKKAMRNFARPKLWNTRIRLCAYAHATMTACARDLDSAPTSLRMRQRIGVKQARLSENKSG